MPKVRRTLKAPAATLVLGILLIASAAVGAAPALAGPTVTVRIEGEHSSLPQTSVTLNAPEPVSGCPANSVAAAINLAVNGNWDHGEANNGGGDFTQSMLGETHAFTENSDTWAEWVNYKWGGGICSDLLNNGDEVLMVADHEPEPFFAPTVLPIVVSGAPSSIQLGVPFTVQVSAVHTPSEAFAEAGEGTPMPLEGASVGGSGASTGTSGSGGTATITLTSAGNITLRATKSGDAPSAPFVVCAHNGNDGNCGTPVIPGGSGSGTPTAGGLTGSGAGAAPYKGPFAVVAKAGGVLNDHVYRLGQAPKVLSGSVSAHAAVASIDLKLRRSYHGRCYAYDGTSERFVRSRCGGGDFFKVSASSSFSYLLPSRLARGRYVLDVEATDAAGNQSSLARGTSRIVFYVR